MGCSSSAAAQPRPAPGPSSPGDAPPPAGVRELLVQVPFNAVAGQLVQVQAPSGQLLQCQVPPGVRPGQQFKIQWQDVIDENVVFDENTCYEAVAFPKYWTNVRYSNNMKFDQMVYVSDQQHSKFQDLLEQTYVAKATQDRQCPKKTCPRTPGGCPCVQVDGSPGLPTGYRIRRVIRVEDSDIWGRYSKKRKEITLSLFGEGKGDAENIPRFDPPVKTDEIAKGNSDVFEPLEAALNEVYLWHGTSVRTALAIAQDDFKIDLAGSNRGTMYGSGAYLCESCTKADEYAKDEPGGYYDGVYALLLCRVVMGRFLYTTEKDEQACEKVKRGIYDSTLGDREKSVGTFREFVLYDADQLYPEYVVLYNRISKNEDPEDAERIRRTLFHMQLPVYWTNCHKDPAKEQFFEQYRVRKSTLDILQRLVDSSYSVSGRHVEIVDARRVENCRIWNSYVNFKRRLKQELKIGNSSKDLGTRSGADSRIGFVKAEELDGDDTSGHVLTHVHLGNESMEESISISNLEENLNEYLLWHGSSKEGAESIIVHDFRIPKPSSNKAHGIRFGYGAYFAEHLGKSLNYAERDEDSVQYVLLCRVLCGDIYYTEEDIETDAGLKREQEKKHSVLAHPKRSNDREFIVPNAEQAYPEFILKVKVLGDDGQLVKEDSKKTLPPLPPGQQYLQCGACSVTFMCPVGVPQVQCGACGQINAINATV